MMHNLACEAHSWCDPATGTFRPWIIALLLASPFILIGVLRLIVAWQHRHD